MVGGLAFGANWGLIPTVIAELFGARAFASNYNFVQVASKRLAPHQNTAHALDPAHIHIPPSPPHHTHTHRFERAEDWRGWLLTFEFLSFFLSFFFSGVCSFRAR